jgi:guanylate kinase
VNHDRNPLLDGQPPPPLLLVISGPSGVGKDSILLRMRERGVPFHFVVTATSRPMRPGERDGKDYHFLTTEEFEGLIAGEGLLEWANVYGHYKGIPKSEVRQAIASGRDVVLRIDVQGAQTIRQLAPGALLVFVAPGDMGELRQRLESRRTDSPAEIDRRFGVAHQEMDTISLFDYVVINREDCLDEAVDQIRAIVFAEKHRVHPRRVTLE